MSTIQKIIPHYTYEDWQYWEGKWELIDGHPIAMSPAPIPKHQRVTAEMRTEIILALRKSGCKKCKAFDPLDYVVSKDTIVIPDILVVCGDIKKKFLDFPPSVVVEILSPATALRDRNTKYQLYEEQGVKFYLIVDVERKTIETYELFNSKYEIRNTQVHNFQLETDSIISPDFFSIFEN